MKDGLAVNNSSHIGLMLLFGMALGCSVQSAAQGTQQQRVYTSGVSTASSFVTSISGFAKVGSTGALVPLAGSPYPSRGDGPMAIDGQGKYIFIAGPTSIAMYAIDPASGAVSEVPRSPFPYLPDEIVNPAPSDALSIATEASGKYVYVGLRNGNLSGSSSILVYGIDTSNSASAVLDYLSAVDSVAPPEQMFVESTGQRLYAVLGVPNPVNIAGFEQYDIFGSTGGLLDKGPVYTTAEGIQASAMDINGRFVFQASGVFDDCFLTSVRLSTTDGTPISSSYIHIGNYANITSLTVDPSGHFLYAYENINAGPPGSTGFYQYSIDQTTGVLTQVGGVESSTPFYSGTIDDPQGPYVYEVEGEGIVGFQIDPTTGNATQIAGSPFSDNASANYAHIAVTRTNAQAVSGPYAEILGNTSFGVLIVGQTSGQTLQVAMENLGQQALAVTGILIAGDSSNSFSQTNNCPAVIAPGGACLVEVTFLPTVVGEIVAALEFTDNGQGGMQSVRLAGVGVTSGSLAQVSLSVPQLSFGNQTQGTTSSAQTVTISNSGTGTTHISSIALTGGNPKDWTETNNCGATLGPQMSCTVSVIFAPSDNGAVSAALTVTDDAPTSPQSANLYGNAPPAAAIQPASGATTSATVTAGQPAQFNLQAMPGAGFNGTLSFVCMGAPTGATCSVPGAVSVTNGAVANFSVSVTTSGAGAALAGRNEVLRAGTPSLMIALLGMLLLRAFGFASETVPRKRAWQAAVAAGILLGMVGCGGGGGGGGGTQTPPPVVTPTGTYTLTVTPSATATGSTKSLALAPVTLTLKVQ